MLGLGALILTNIGKDPTHLTFSLIAFTISVAALLLTTLQSVSIARQMLITERAAKDVRETGEQLKELISKDQRLAKYVQQDIALDRQIIAALEEHGVGRDEQHRREVAKRIAAKLSRHQ